MENMRNKIESSTSGGSVNSRFRCKSSASSAMNILTKLKITHDKNMKANDSLRMKRSKTSFRDFLGNIHEEEAQVSDSESSSTTGSPKGGAIGMFDDIGLVKLEEEENGYQLIKKAFLGGMEMLGKHIHVVSVHRNSFMGLAEQARLQTFRVFSEMMTKKRRSHGGNIKFAWYGTSKDGINRIINHGFSHCGKFENNGMYGHGIYLSPHSSCLDSVMSASQDKDGLKHVLLCRVILGNMEEIPFGSEQTHPSAKVYDSGVDNILSPKKYIVWTANMNTHILPEYVITFKAPPSLNSIQEAVAPPKSPWIGLGTLISVLSRFLPRDTVILIQKYHSQFQERKLSRHEMIQHVRQAVGDKLLISVIKSFRAQDIEANNRKVKVYGRDYTFQETKWKQVRVGDLVKVEKDEYFPSDLLLLSSNYDDGICYVETMNLDGETNLKVKQSLEVTSLLRDEYSLRSFKPVIRCEDPNENLYSFVGTLYYNGAEHPLSPQQLLLRDSKLRNTDLIYGLVIFTGHDTKVMQNATDPPSKRSKIERRMDKIIYVLFSALILISSVGSVFFGIETKGDINGREYKRWYLRPDASTVYFDPRRAALAAFYHFLTGLMLYGSLIPISLYVSIEIVKVLQSLFINQDQDMYYEETDRPARARTSNLNEELGQVDTILSDKTGTLTRNLMEFVKCSIAGVSYGEGSTEVEKAIARRKKEGTHETSDASIYFGEYNSEAKDSLTSVRGFNFSDERIMNGIWVREAQSNVIQRFFHVLAICHTVIPAVAKDSGEITYEAESPDEASFFIAAREIGFEFYERTQSSISLRERDLETGEKIKRSFELLHVLEFSSYRKRMSVVVRNEEGQLLLLCKGADSAIFGRLSENGRLFEAKTKDHIAKYDEAGLRTLLVAYRELSEEEYRTWKEEFLKARNSLTADRNAMVDAAADKIERNLFLLGATAVEDKLQKGVPECINRLAQAGIKIWVLTGDKIETAINIGYASSLLRKGMNQIVITLDSPDILALEKQGDKDATAKASWENVMQQINEGKSQISLVKKHSTASALIIDGKSLTYALMENLENIFWELAVDCTSVICCRSSPKQKALVTRLVKLRTGKTTLAIGDGANDVSMLQEADIGVGISGVEGMQAAMSSDFAIAQFRFLERLLLVHGHWCYRRIAMMICYFFYKNITFGFTLFMFEAHASFSGQPAYNDWYISFYNVFFTSLPVIALGVFDQDVSARLCLKYPLLHQEGVQNTLFRWCRIIGWMLNGVISSIIIFFFTTNSILVQAFRKDGRVAGSAELGVAMYTYVVWTVNCQMALSINYFTWIQHIFIWSSIIFWYIFLFIYGLVPPTVSTTAYKVLVEACAPSAYYWLTTLAVVISALVPYFTYHAFQTRFFPMYHNIIQMIR